MSSRVSAEGATMTFLDGSTMRLRSAAQLDCVGAESPLRGYQPFRWAVRMLAVRALEAGAELLARLALPPRAAGTDYDEETGEYVARRDHRRAASLARFVT